MDGLLRRVRGYFINRELGLLNGLFSNVIGINLGLGLAAPSEIALSRLLQVYFVYGFVLWHGLYFLNDLYDLEEDSQHPEKRLRPLAAGRLTKRDVKVIIAVHLFSAVVLTYRISQVLLLLTLATIFQQYLYCVPPVRLKRFLFVGTFLSGPIGWSTRFLVGWSVFRSLKEVPIQFPLFMVAFAFPAYLYRRVDHGLKIGITIPQSKQTAITVSRLTALTVAILLFVHMYLWGLLNRAVLILLFIYIGTTGGLLLASRRSIGLTRFETIAKVITLLASCAFLLLE